MTLLAHSTHGLDEVAERLAAYRAGDIFDGRLWRLPLSGLLAQSWLQWGWTIVVGCALFIALESRLGSVRTLATLGLSHIVPTVAVAVWARVLNHGSVLAMQDFGTSCLIMGAAGALLCVSRSRLLAAALLATMVGDVFLNSTLTIIEHLIAVTIGVASATAFSAQLRHERRAPQVQYELE
jgi:hypothetical protein